MADQKTSQLTAAAALDGTEEVPINQAGTSKKATVALLRPTVDAVPTNGSANPVGSGGVFDALALKVGISEINGNAIPHFPMTPVIVRKYNMTAGENDIYTVPAGKKLFVPQWQFNNTTGVAIVCIMKVKIGATYYRLEVNFNVAANGTGNSGSWGYIFNAGEIVAVNAAAAGVSFAARGFLFADTVPFKSVRLNSMAVGDNELYPCPPDKTAIVYGFGGGGFHSAPNIVITNDTGAAITFKTSVVPSGIANALIYQKNSASLATASKTTHFAEALLAAGDRIIVNSSSATAGQTAAAHVYEI